LVETLRRRFALARLSTNGDEEGEEDEDGLEDEEGEPGDDEGDGDFEDLEADEEHSGSNAANQAANLEAEREKNARKKEELKLRFEEEDRDGFANDSANARKEGAEGATEEFGEDDWYDAQKARIQKQLDINRAEFEEMDEVSRSRVEGYRAGTYARIVLTDVPYEFSAHFNPRMPLVIGGLNPTEDRFGFLQVRIKRHRWHPKILKSNDPLIFSLGWRRFQSIPIYTTSFPTKHRVRRAVSLTPFPNLTQSLVRLCRSSSRQIHLQTRFLPFLPDPLPRQLILRITPRQPSLQLPHPLLPLLLPPLQLRNPIPKQIIHKLQLRNPCPQHIILVPQTLRI